MRIVIKVGTSTLTHGTGRLNIRRVEALCKVLSDIKNAGHEVVLVSSGAIGMGVGKLKLREEVKRLTLPTEMGERFQLMGFERDVDLSAAFLAGDLTWRL